jgi:hypothetical protein
MEGQQTKGFERFKRQVAAHRENSLSIVYTESESTSAQRLSSIAAKDAHQYTRLTWSSLAFSLVFRPLVT